MPFAASDSLPHLCGACWHRKDAHTVEGDCPERAPERPGAGSVPAEGGPR